MNAFYLIILYVKYKKKDTVPFDFLSFNCILNRAKRLQTVSQPTHTIPHRLLQQIRNNSGIIPHNL